MVRRRGRGQALVEFALVFPIFILIVVALFDLGRAVYAYNTITNAAREGARLAIVNQDGPSITARVEAQAVGVDASSCFRFLKAGLTSTDCASEPAANLCPTPATIGCVATVEVRTQYSAITPIVGALVGPMTLTARTELPVEFTCPNPVISEWASAGSCPKQP